MTEEVDVEKLGSEVQPFEQKADEYDPEAAVKGLLIFEKPLLASFSLTMDNGGYGDSALRELAKKATSLRSMGSLQDVAVLDVLAKNAPLLDHVHIRFMKQADQHAPWSIRYLSV